MENEELQANNQEEEKDKTNYVDIFPLKKGRRVLVFLADFFIVLIASIFLFNIAVYPIARHITNGNAIDKEVEVLNKEQFDILYNNEILFYNENEKYIYSSNLNKTMEEFIYYYVNDEKNIKQEVIHHYFCELNDNDISYIDSFYKANNSTSLAFFDFEKRDANGLPLMNDKFKEEFKDYLAFPNENKDTEAESDYNLFYQYFFVNAYGNLMKDVVEKDLSYPGIELSYNKITARVNELTTANENVVVICATVTYVFIIAMLLVLIPFVTRRGKTPAHAAMRVERVKKVNLNLCGVNEKVSASIFYLIAFFPSLMFIPFPTFSFYDIFSFSFLFIISIIGLAFDIISLIYLLFSKYNQTLSDLASLSILITSDSLDEIYRMKGYVHG